MGAPDFEIEPSGTRDEKTHGPLRLSRILAKNIPYAHTVGQGGSGHKFRLLLLIIALTLCICTIIAPQRVLTAALFTFTALICLQAVLRVYSVICSKSDFEFADTAPLDWPRYTVLVPLKDEAHMVTGLITTLSKFDYPQDRLQIIFIIEEDDPLTCRAVNKVLRPPFQQVVVPRSGETAPRTKPHALNIAMQRASGEIVTIYDAEDTPHPNQLKTAVRAFQKNPHWGALQAPLDYHNTGDSWLSAQFGLEYAAQFHVWIPLMVRLRLPFPLGGTSNHIRRSALESIRNAHVYWDSYNVTEDADLSFRLSALGWDIGYITPPTQEEAVARLKPWTHQRTRWMKGFMQSWRVHMDSPLAPGGWRGARRQLTLQLTLGSVLLAGFFHAPICLALLIWMGHSWVTQGVINFSPLVTLSLVLGYGSGILIGAVGALRAGKPKLLLSLPVMPIYWLCLCPPSYRAAVEYIRRPFYWAKTSHGVTRSQAADVQSIAANTALQLGLAANDSAKAGIYKNAAIAPKAAE